MPRTVTMMYGGYFNASSSSSMLYTSEWTSATPKMVVMKTVVQHSVDKSMDEGTPSMANKTEYPNSVVPLKGPPEVEGQKLTAEAEG